MKKYRIYNSDEYFGDDCPQYADTLKEANKIAKQQRAIIVSIGTDCFEGDEKLSKKEAIRAAKEAIRISEAETTEEEWAVFRTKGWRYTNIEFEDL